MLYTASRACLQHPDVAAYKANRDLIYKQLQHAVSGISNAAQATATEDSALSQPAGGGELAYALNNFDVSQMSGLQVTTHLPFLTSPARHPGICQIIKNMNFKMIFFPITVWHSSKGMTKLFINRDGRGLVHKGYSQVIFLLKRTNPTQ